MVEQGGPNESHSACGHYRKVIHDMQSLLLKAYLGLEQLRQNAPLSRAKYRWVDDREEKVCGPELDVGSMGTGSGATTDISLIELGWCTEVGADFKGACSCFPETKFDGQD